MRAWGEGSRALSCHAPKLLGSSLIKTPWRKLLHVRPTTWIDTYNYSMLLVALCEGKLAAIESMLSN